MVNKKEVIDAKKSIDQLKKEVSKVIIGQEVVVDSLIRGMLSNGHVLIEGLPGIAKTLIVRAIAKCTGSDFQRIQFTPDLLPSDLVGITAYEPKKGFFTIKGPIFSQFILADEINRCGPKTQSALLEAMQEREVTIGKKTFSLPIPFFVLATENPLEHLGTYPLPEAQVDRFLFKLRINYPNFDEELLIMKRNIDLIDFKDFKLNKVMPNKKLLSLQRLTKNIFLDPKIEKYIANIVDATRNPNKHKIQTGKFIQWGASPRASIGLYIASKANAVLLGRNFVTPQDIKTVAPDILRHRILLSYEGQAERISQDKIISEILDKIPIP